MPTACERAVVPVHLPHLRGAIQVGSISSHTKCACGRTTAIGTYAARRESLGAGACAAVDTARAARDPVVVVSTTHREPSHAPVDTVAALEARANRLTPRRNSEQRTSTRIETLESRGTHAARNSKQRTSTRIATVEARANGLTPRRNSKARC
jgi:hypothetical protein